MIFNLLIELTSAELKKIRRGQIAGDEPGDEDEDKSPVGPSYNEEDEMSLLCLAGARPTERTS